MWRFSIAKKKVYQKYVGLWQQQCVIGLKQTDHSFKPEKLDVADELSQGIMGRGSNGTVKKIVNGLCLYSDYLVLLLLHKRKTTMKCKLLL